MGSDSPLSSCHISGLMKCFFSLLFLCLSVAGGSGPEDGQNNQQAVSGIYEHTLGTVSHCPSVTEYTQRAFEKCAEVCGIHMQDGGCSYHCMRDSYKTSLVEFCGKPKILWDVCPMYDPIGRTIQMDLSTLCNPSNSSQGTIFMSSDIFVCNPDNCLRLREAAVSTAHSMIESTTSSGGINDGWFVQYLPIIIGVALIVCIGGIIYYLRKKMAALLASFQRLLRLFI